MREITDPQLLALLESGDLPEHPMARYGPAVRHVESRGNPNATSPAGAMGADQFMPATARAMGLSDPRDPVMSGVARDLLLAENYDRFKDPAKALAAYNAGPTVVASGRPLPKETQDYVPKVLSVMGIRSAQAAEQPAMREVTDPELIARLEGSAKPVTLSSTVAKQATGAPKESATAKAAREEFESMPFYQQALVGAGKSVADLGRTVGLLPKGDKEIDDQISGWGTAGNIAGEIALTALPGGAAYKVAGKVLPKAAGMVSRSVVGGGAAGATAEAMMGRDAAEGAGVGAVLGPVGYYGAKGANAVVNELLRMKGGARGRAVESTQDMFKKGDRLDQAIKDLENTTPIIAGERPTAGLAATAATPELAVMEAGARSRQNANLFTQAD